MESWLYLLFGILPTLILIGIIVLIFCWVKVLSFDKSIKYIEKRLFDLERSSNKTHDSHFPAQKPPIVTQEEIFTDTNEWENPSLQESEQQKDIAIKKEYPKYSDITHASDSADEWGNQKNEQPISPSPAWLWIKENWTGFLGVAAVVLGVAFGGAYVGFFATPLIRFMMIAIVGMGFVGLSVWLRGLKTWSELGSWLQAGGGAIILLAFMGGGYFEGLRFYDSRVMGFILMAIGLAINMGLAYFKPKQTLSAAHVVLSLLALSAAPAIVPILWAGAVISVFGIILSHQRQWNLNLAASLVAFTILSHLWRFENEAAVLWHGIGASLLVFIPSLLVHYRHIYKDKDIYASSWTHLIAWGLFGYNLFLFQQGYSWVSIPLALGALAALCMSFYAKRRHVSWLFAIDFLVGELLLVLASLALIRFEFSSHFIAWIIATQTFLFLALSLHQRWYKVVGLNILFSAVALIGYVFVLFDAQTHVDYLREMLLGTIIIFYMGYHLVAKNSELSTVKIAKMGSIYINLSLLFLACVLLVTLVTRQGPIIGYWLVALATIGMLLNKRLMQINEHKFSVLFFMLASLISSWFFVSFVIEQHDITAAMILWKSFYLAVLPMGLMLLATLYDRTLYFEEEDYWFVDYMLYIFGIHMALYMIWLTHPVNAYLPALLVLAGSVLCMECRKGLVNQENPKFELSAVAFNNIGLWALVAFVSCFALDVIHSQATVFSFFSIRVLVAGAGIIAGFAWMQNKLPEENPYQRYQLPPSLGFDIGLILSICLLVLEFAAPMHGVGYSLLGIALITIPRLTDMMPARKYLYSFGLLVATLIHVPIVSSQWASPLSNWYETSHVMGIIALLLSAVLATLLGQKDFANTDMRLGPLNYVNGLYNIDKPLISYLPIFISLGLFLFWRFDGAVLTALWVGEVFVCVLLGIYIKHKALINVAYGFLMVCLVRLVVYDFAQSDLLMRAFVFVVVGLLMIGMHVTYQKLKGRLE